MIKHTDHFHGSDLEKIEQLFEIKKENITSFSANVNPLGVSFRLRETLANHIDAITGYPDREYTKLRKCIASYVQTDYNDIIVGNGSTELISLIIQIKKPKNALITGPTYSEYEREVLLNGGHCHYFELKEEDNFILNFSSLYERLKSDIDLLILCNPNNPTSSALTKNDICNILNFCKEKNIFVMVDETYVEFVENVGLISSIPLTVDYDNIIVLRGISKFFAAPGLRLGYAVCSSQELREEINERKNPWTINSLAAIAGEIMFRDTGYINKTRDLISSERIRLLDRLNSCRNIKVYPPTANFVLIRILKDNVTSADLFESAIRKGLMIRDCENFIFLNNKYIRFCFMTPEKNDELLDLLLDKLN